MSTWMRGKRERHTEVGLSTVLACSYYSKSWGSTNVVEIHVEKCTMFLHRERKVLTPAALNKVQELWKGKDWRRVYETQPRKLCSETKKTALLKKYNNPEAPQSNIHNVWDIIQKYILKRKSIKCDCVMNQMFQLTDKDLKASITTVLQHRKITYV